MNLQQLGTQLKREAAANKGKAAVLATITLVALYFWLPLLADWCSSDAGTPETPAVAAPSSSGAAPRMMPSPDETVGNTANNTVKNTDKNTLEDLPPWQDLAQWMDDDPRMKSAQLSQTTIDPFRTIAAADTTTDENTEDSQQQDGDDTKIRMTSGNLGLQLTSTLIGSRRCVVIINGRSYVYHNRKTEPSNESRPHSNQIVCRTSDGDLRFDIVSVKPGLVVLQRGNEQFTLKTKSANLAGREAIGIFSGSN